MRELRSGSWSSLYEFVFVTPQSKRFLVQSADIALRLKSIRDLLIKLHMQGADRPIIIALWWWVKHQCAKIIRVLKAIRTSLLIVWVSKFMLFNIIFDQRLLRHFRLQILFFISFLSLWSCWTSVNQVLEDKMTLWWHGETTNYRTCEALNTIAVTSSVHMGKTWKISQMEKIRMWWSTQRIDEIVPIAPEDSRLFASHEFLCKTVKTGKNHWYTLR